MSLYEICLLCFLFLVNKISSALLLSTNKSQYGIASSPTSPASLPFRYKLPGVDPSKHALRNDEPLIVSNTEADIPSPGRSEDVLSDTGSTAEPDESQSSVEPPRGDYLDDEAIVDWDSDSGIDVCTPHNPPDFEYDWLDDIDTPIFDAFDFEWPEPEKRHPDEMRSAYAREFLKPYLAENVQDILDATPASVGCLWLLPDTASHWPSTPPVAASMVELVALLGGIFSTWYLDRIAKRARTYDMEAGLPLADTFVQTEAVSSWYTKMVNALTMAAMRHASLAMGDDTEQVGQGDVADKPQLARPEWDDGDATGPEDAGCPAAVDIYLKGKTAMDAWKKHSVLGEWEREACRLIAADPDGAPTTGKERREEDGYIVQPKDPPAVYHSSTPASRVRSEYSPLRSFLRAMFDSEVISHVPMRRGQAFASAVRGEHHGRLKGIQMLKQSCGVAHVTGNGRTRAAQDYPLASRDVVQEEDPCASLLTPPQSPKPIAICSPPLVAPGTGQRKPRPPLPAPEAWGRLDSVYGRPLEAGLSDVLHLCQTAAKPRSGKGGGELHESHNTLVSISFTPTILRQNTHRSTGKRKRA
ncbi:hypothetical protein SCUCBS95973_007367 [Sporothrix curviconia]|uniref:Uncharacterized protein n=1 Tax=Sporothrix curviconia TaxID=1260050 RepID=A0ABP0CCR6_9PEZI